MRYGLDLERYERIGKEIVIMHPGPINRGVEVTSRSGGPCQQHHLGPGGERCGHPDGGALPARGTYPTSGCLKV